MRSPVLFLVFNRPETTRRVFEAIRAARPSRLYVAADGAHPDMGDEARRCEEVRRIATAVDWPCEVITLFRDQNWGCKRAVSSAIDWFFSQEPEGVILEDDCLPHPSFFAYCDNLLERYRDDAKVMCVSGVNFIADAWSPEESYYFSVYSHVWGWGSWRRAWRHYDVELEDWHTGKVASVLKETFPESASERRHWSRVFKAVATGKIDTWDYQWTYACFSQAGVSALPSVNLISNIGFGVGATHTKSSESKMANLPSYSLPFPLRHPALTSAATAADHWTSRQVFEILPAALHWQRRLWRGLMRMCRAMSYAR